MGKTQYGGKRVKRQLTYKKTNSIKPLNLLKNLVGSSKKKIKVGRKVVRKDFLKKTLGVRFPKLIGGKRRTKTRSGKKIHKSRKYH